MKTRSQITFASLIFYSWKFPALSPTHHLPILKARTQLKCIDFSYKQALAVDFNIRQTSNAGYIAYSIPDASKLFQKLKTWRCRWGSEN